MNLVGKILVVFIFLMSVVFMGLAISVASTHKDWIEKAQRAQQDLQKAQADTQKAQVAFDAYKEQVLAEAKVHDEAIAKLDTKYKDLEGSKKAVDDQLAQLKDESAKQLAALTTAQTSLNQRLEQITKLREDVSTAQSQRDARFKEYVELQDKFNVAESDLQRAKEMNGRLAQQEAKAKMVLDRHGLDINTPAGNIPPVKVYGIVLATGTNGLVEVSIGQDDGLQRGNTLEVWRGSNYLGRLEVLRTDPDRSVAKVMPAYQRGKIERDDRVATRLQ